MTISLISARGDQQMAKEKDPKTGPSKPPSKPETKLGYGTILVRRSNEQPILNLGTVEIVIQGPDLTQPQPATVLSERAHIVLRNAQDFKNTIQLQGDDGRVTLTMGESVIVLDAEKA